MMAYISAMAMVLVGGYFSASLSMACFYEGNVILGVLTGLLYGLCVLSVSGYLILIRKERRNDQSS